MRKKITEFTTLLNRWVELDDGKSGTIYWINKDGTIVVDTDSEKVLYNKNQITYIDGYEIDKD